MSLSLSNLNNILTKGQGLSSKEAVTSAKTSTSAGYILLSRLHRNDDIITIQIKRLLNAELTSTSTFWKARKWQNVSAPLFLISIPDFGTQNGVVTKHVLKKDELLNKVMSEAELCCWFMRCWLCSKSLAKQTQTTWGGGQKIHPFHWWIQSLPSVTSANTITPAKTITLAYTEGEGGSQPLYMTLLHLQLSYIFLWRNIQLM